MTAAASGSPAGRGKFVAAGAASLLNSLISARRTRRFVVCLSDLARSPLRADIHSNAPKGDNRIQPSVRGGLGTSNLVTTSGRRGHNCSRYLKYNE
jgi:hypothetical protein